MSKPFSKNPWILSITLAALAPTAAHAYEKVPPGQSLLVMNRSQTNAEKFKERLKNRGFRIVNEVRCKKDGWSIFEVKHASDRIDAALARIRNSGDIDLEGAEVKTACRFTQCTPAINDPEFASQLTIQQIDFGEMTCLLDAKSLSQVQQPRFTLIDSGVSPITNEMTTIQQFNFAGGANGTVDAVPFDSGIHGTGVASVACATTNNANLLAGVASHAGQTVKVVCCRISNDGASIDQLDVDRALAWCVDNQSARGGPGVINLSIQNNPTYNASPVVQGIAKSLAKQGDLLVNGAGNSPIEDPSKSKKGIRRVAGLDETDSLWVNSTFGPFEAAAPCVNVRIYDKGTSAAGFRTGTSLASPTWAGAVALLMSLSPKLDAIKADKLLFKTGAETEEGYVKPDLRAAIIKALKLKP